jgi:type II secretion system protein H
MNLRTFILGRYSVRSSRSPEPLFRNNALMKIVVQRRSTCFSAKQRGFSLVELLVVIAIVGVLTSISVPMISSLNQAGNVTKTVYDLASTMENARAAAMANNTYVWVGVKGDDRDNRLQVTAVMGKTGQSDDLGNAANYVVLAKPQVYENITLQKSLNVPGKESGAASILEADVGEFTQTVLGKSVTFEQVVQFSPGGQVTIVANKPSRWIEIGLQPARANAKTQKNIAALQISGLTGQVRVFRP